VVYTLAVFYVIVKNPHAVINWVLSILFLLFALWSVCSCVLDNNSVSDATAEIVMKVQSIGWSSFISFYFLFILYLTNNKKIITGQLLILLILVIPGIFIYQDINGNMLECCRKVSYGTAGTWKKSIWPALYFAYYIIMFFGGAYLLIRYRNKTLVKAEKQIVDILLASAVAVFVIGTIFTVIMNYMHIYNPVDANIVFLIFVSGFIYSAEKYETFNLSSTRNADMIMDLITDGIVLLDRIGAVTTANRAANELFGFGLSAEASSGYGFIESMIRRAGVSADGEEVINAELTFVDAVGAEKTVLISSKALLKDKKHSGRVCTVRDITTKKKAELDLVEKVKELERSNEDLESFAYVASHDLKEPLSMVTDYLQLIRKKFREKLDKDLNDFLNNVSEGAIKMSGLLEALLDYSRVTKSKREHVPVDTAKALSRVMAAMKFSIVEKKATVSMDGQLPAVKGDKIQIEQVFRNLIDNALKFSGKNRPVVNISSESKGDYFEFMVKDNGIGLAAEDFEKVFHIFQRLHPKTEYEGAGVGLATCKKIVDSHGGRIWVISEGLGKGSVFKFTLPAVK
jgi:PAS domain S-box-containing protein